MNTWSINWHSNCKHFEQQCYRERAKLLAALHRPKETQESVLMDIITSNEETVFGKQHGYSRVGNIKSFQQKTPIRGYDELNLWITQEVDARGGVLTNSPITRWLKTSGSTGNSKKVPYTVDWMKKYRVPALYALWANYIKYVPEILSHQYATLDTQTTREPVADFLNEIPYQGITNRDLVINEFDWQPPWYDAPWFRREVPSSYDIRMYYRLRYFLGEDLRAILTINPSTLVAIKHHLIKNLPTLAKEIHDGTIYGHKYCQPNHFLATQLEQLQNNSDFPLTLLWPNLSLISCWTSASATLYLSQIEKLFPKVKLLPFMSCGTEGIVTLPIDDHPITGPLAINQGFYEFLPATTDIGAVIRDEKNVETLLFDQLKIGEEYHLIMTQDSGMCRYAVGDIYRVTDFYMGVPRIEYVRRHGTCYSFTGEKLTEKELFNVVQNVFNKYELHGNLFLFCPVWSDPPYYKLLIELESDKHTLINLLEKEFDDLLRKSNEEYDSKRKSNRLDHLKLFCVKTGVIEKFLEQQKVGNNATQIKYQPFQKNEVLFDALIKQSIV